MKLVLVNKNGAEEIIKDYLEKILKDNEAEFNFITAKAEKYTIDEIKAFTRNLGKKPNSSKNTKSIVYVILKAETLSNVCQNALLKTLEESEYSIILNTNSEQILLPTIRSRCQVEYLKNDQEAITNSTELLDFSNIATWAKKDRAEVKLFLANKMNELKPDEVEKALIIEDAIKKIDANCKVDAVLFELVSKLKD